MAKFFKTDQRYVLIEDLEADYYTAAEADAEFLDQAEADARYFDNVQTATINTAPALTTVIPLDNTIPQISEGTQILSVSITPRATTSMVRLTLTLQGTINAVDNLVAALFANGAANAIKAGYVTITLANGLHTLVLRHIHSPASTSQQIYTARVGPSGGGNTATINGNVSAGVFFGGTFITMLEAEEVRL